jgi:single-stranded-DNA-specific exonuclease
MTSRPAQRWIDPAPQQPSGALLQAAGHPLVARILAQRGLEEPALVRAFIDPDVYTPTPATELPDLPVAVDHLLRAIAAGERILVWGDFDVDGQTATAVLVSALRDLGAEVRGYIPDRIREGHGIVIDTLQGQLVGTDLLLTCDTGVSEHAALAYAAGQGVSALVTDHHDLPPQLPPAGAIVNPKRLPPDHPLHELPGVGVAYKLAEALYQQAGEPPDRAEALLDLVALGIVADVATQVADTRYLLQRGLRRLRRAERAGLQALMALARLNPERLDTTHIAFGLGPRLNALGRLGDANLSLELFLTTDLTRARVLAAQLEGLNSRRRLLTEQVYGAAQEQISEDPALLDQAALVLAGPRWHPGVIGIVAGRLAELYHRPVVVISVGEEGQARGSARSVPGIDIHAAISSLAPLLIGHGGHAGAAGLRLRAENLDEFRDGLVRAVAASSHADATPELAIDAVLPWSQPSLELVEALDVLAPFGEGNPPILLASRGLELVSERIFGPGRDHRRLVIRDSDGQTHEVIWWRGAERGLPQGTFDLAYTVKASDYRGERELQIEYVAARATDGAAIVEAPVLYVVDHRAAPAPRDLLAQLEANERVAVWAEGFPGADAPGLRRDQLTPAPALAIWTPPPGPRELRAVLEQVQPRTVYLFAVAAAAPHPRGFVKQLAGLVKHDLQHKQGFLDLERLAAASGQRMETVREGVRLLQANGYVAIVERDGPYVRVVPGDRRPKPKRDAIAARLQALLQETAAYRAYFGRASAGQLIPDQARP